jgi:hypothetical protein
MLKPKPTMRTPDCKSIKARRIGVLVEVPDSDPMEGDTSADNSDGLRTIGFYATNASRLVQGIGRSRHHERTRMLDTP